MSSNAVVSNIIRFIVLLGVQGLFLKRVSEGWEGWLYINIIIYPVFIIMLPLQTPRTAVLLLSFLMGFFVDLFYDSLGVHAFAMTATGFARPLMLQLFEPREGYKQNYFPTPNSISMGWFLRYTSAMMGLHLLLYFSVDAFSPVYFLSILLKTVYTFIFSMLSVFVFIYLFNPKR